MSVSEDEQTQLMILSVVTSSISFIASMSVVTTIIMGQYGYCRGILRGVKVERLSFHLIMMVSISDSIRTFGNLFGSPETDTALCGLQAFFKIFGGTASFAWISVIAFVMYKLLLNTEKWDKFTFERLKRIFHGISWLFALINALIPVIGGYYHEGAVWCFIDNSSAGILLRFFCYYMWCVVAWLVAVVLYFRIWHYMKESQVDIWSLPTVSKLLYYPLIFFFCWFWSLLRRAWNAFDDADHAPIALIGLQVFFGNLYGFANAMLYGWIVRHHLKEASSQQVRTESSAESVSGAKTPANIQTQDSTQEIQDTADTKSEVNDNTSDVTV